jgi:RHS repeat-associated protein
MGCLKITYKNYLTFSKSKKSVCSDYRYGFNGQERDNELKGEGNSLDFGARIYDSRLGRFLSLDPLQAKYPKLTPYCFVGNSPLIFIDPDGRVISVYGDDIKSFVSAIKKTGALKVSFDVKTNQLTLSNPDNLKLSASDAKLLEASQNANIECRVLTTKQDVIDNDAMTGGSFQGSSGTSEDGKELAWQYVNMSHFKKMEGSGVGNVAKKDARHELLELYIGASEDLEFTEAHNATMLIYPDIEMSGVNYQKVEGGPVYAYGVKSEKGSCKLYEVDGCKISTRENEMLKTPIYKKNIKNMSSLKMNKIKIELKNPVAETI